MLPSGRAVAQANIWGAEQALALAALSPNAAKFLSVNMPIIFNLQDREGRSGKSPSFRVGMKAEPFALVSDSDNYLDL